MSVLLRTNVPLQKYNVRKKRKEKKNNKKTDQNPTRPLVLLLYFHFRSHKIPDTAAVSFVFNHSLQTMFDITDFFTSFAEECTAFVLEQSAIFNAQHSSSACVCVCVCRDAGMRQSCKEET